MDCSSARINYQIHSLWSLILTSLFQRLYSLFLFGLDLQNGPRRDDLGVTGGSITVSQLCSGFWIRQFRELHWISRRKFHGSSMRKQITKKYSATPSSKPVSRAEYSSPPTLHTRNAFKNTGHGTHGSTPGVFSSRTTQPRYQPACLHYSKPETVPETGISRFDLADTTSSRPTMSTRA